MQKAPKGVRALLNHNITGSAGAIAPKANMVHDKTIGLSNAEHGNRIVFSNAFHDNTLWLCNDVIARARLRRLRGLCASAACSIEDGPSALSSPCTLVDAPFSFALWAFILSSYAHGRSRLVFSVLVCLRPSALCAGP